MFTVCYKFIIDLYLLKDTLDPFFNIYFYVYSKPKFGKTEK